MRSTILLALLVGCGGGGSSLEGMYTIDAWNENPTTCTDPGPSVLGDGSHSETVFYIKTESFLGTSFLNAKACTDLTECEAEAADDETINLGEFGTFEQGNDDDGWTETFAFGFEDFTDPTMCAGTISNDKLTADGETAVTIRMETVHTLYPKDGAGECTDEDAMASGAGVPCDELELVHGALVGEI